MIRLGIIGDYKQSVPSHLATNEALAHIEHPEFEYEWVPTNQIREGYDCFLIAPGSPYKDMQAVLDLIEFARLNKIPTLGTCGGFQHMVIEFARNVLNIVDAEHAETNPYASKLVISPLSCSLRGQALPIQITDKESLVYKALQSDMITEEYYCNFGLNPEYQQQIHNAGFRMVGTDEHNEVRILELKDHPFFIGTLFVPQHNSRPGRLHPLLVALIENAKRY